VTVPAPMLFSAAILSRGKPLNHCSITRLLITSSIGDGILYCYITLIALSSDARHVEFGMEWNCIRGTYTYSIDDGMADDIVLIRRFNC